MSTIGPGRFTDAICSQPLALLKAGALTDILVPTVEDFPSPKEAEEFLREKDCPFWIWTKGGGPVRVKNQSEALILLSTLGSGPVSVMMGSKGGTMIHVGGLFDGTKFVPPMFYQFWWEKFGARGIGPTMEEPLGQICWTQSRVSRLHEETLLRLLPLLRKADYRGPIALRLVVSSNDIIATRCIADLRLAIPLLEGWRSTADVLSSLAMGRGEQKTRRAWFCSVNFSTIGQRPIMPTPTDGVLKHLALQNLAEDRRVSGHPIGYACAWGTDAGEARRRAYRVLSGVTIPELYYRPDIGRGVTVPFQKLTRGRWI